MYARKYWELNCNHTHKLYRYSGTSLLTAIATVPTGKSKGHVKFTLEQATKAQGGVEV
jgi:hypothetical protein